MVRGISRCELLSNRTMATCELTGSCCTKVLTTWGVMNLGSFFFMLPELSMTKTRSSGGLSARDMSGRHQPGQAERTQHTDGDANLPAWFIVQLFQQLKKYMHTTASSDGDGYGTGWGALFYVTK